MINPTLLRSFCTLVDVGHFTHTAERLYMTQSGVSQHIRKLEEQVGQALLVRHGKQFTLTDAGNRLYVKGQHIIQSLTELEQDIKSDPTFEGLVKIMSPGSVGLKLYSHLLGVQQTHRKLTIDYRFGPNDNVEDAINELKIDMGFMTKQSQHSNVICEAVAKEALFLVTPASAARSNKSESKKGQPSWAQLQQLGFINHPDGAHHASLLLSENFKEFQHINDFEMNGFSNQISLILEPVSMGLGFTVLPAYAVEAFHSPALIKSHRLAKPASETLYLCRNRNQPRPNRVALVMDEAKKWLLRWGAFNKNLESI